MKFFFSQSVLSICFSLVVFKEAYHTSAHHSTTPESIVDIVRNPRDCLEWRSMGEYKEGVYQLDVGKLVNAYCDDKGWAVIQKRSDGSVDYNRSLEEYSQGFGDVGGEHWLGLDIVHRLTADQHKWTLRVELESFDNKSAWAEYTGFSVGAGPGFILNLDKSSYRGTAGNSLDWGRYYTLHRGMKFTTYDHDQDEDMWGNCADIYGGGGWWYNDCLHVTTTGMSYESGIKSIYWHMWRGHERLKAVTLKIRRNFVVRS